MVIRTIPFMPIPYKAAKSFIRGFYPFSSRLMKFFPRLKEDLETIDSIISAKDYLSGALFTFCFYFVILLVIFLAAAYRMNSELLDTIPGRLQLIALALLIPAAIFLNTVILPRWFASKKIRELEKDLLFATRHLMIQTTAGVPLFDAVVSVSEEYGNPKLDYGIISREFKKIVAEVRTGGGFTEALEKSAARNASLYYRKVVWQLANATRAGSDIGNVLKNMVEYLSAEQRIMIQDYGSQLNPLALFYMLTCIIAPTMGLIFLMILSTFVELNITPLTFVAILLLLLVLQITFVGLIKSRRPKVAI
jgi:pilus assembly protein TadC